MKKYVITVNGAKYEVVVEEADINAKFTKAETPKAAPAAPAAAPAAPATAAKSGPGAGAPVKAPLPGVVTKILVKEGQGVKKGETVLVLEAMKMENNITAEADGTVTGICVSAGDSVMEGTTLITIG